MSLEKYPRPNPKAALTFELLCLRCGSAIKPGRKFCSQCGAVAGAAPNGTQAGFAGRVSVCPECGFENHRSDRFCKACAGLLADVRGGVLTRDAVETHVVAPVPEEPGSGVNGETVPQPGFSSGPLSAQETVAASVAAPDSEAFAVPVSEETAWVAPAYFQRPNSSPLRTLGLAGLAIVLITGAVLLYSYHPAGKSAKPALASSTLAATTSPSSAVEAGNTFVPNETVSKLSRTARKVVAPARVQNKPDSPRKLQEIAKTDIPQSSPSMSRDLPSPKMTPADAGSSAVAPQPVLPTPAGSAGVSPVASSTPSSDAVANTSAASAKPAPLPPAATVVANLEASIAPAGDPSPAKPASPAASIVPPTAKPAARGDVAPLRVGGNVQAGKLLSQTAPIYPVAASAAGVQGSVRLDAVIAKDGTVRDLKVLSGNPILIGAALYAVRRWRYRPTELDGQVVEVRTEINIEFQLH